MEQKTDRIYSSATIIEKDDLEQRLERKQMMLTVLMPISTTLKNDYISRR